MIKTIPLLISYILIFFTRMAAAQSSGDYRSNNVNGTWSTPSHWDKYNGTIWAVALTAPTSADGVITIQTGKPMTSNGMVTADQLVIENGATLSITGGTFSVAEGAGKDLKASGTLSMSAGTLNGDGLVEVQSGGALNWSGGNIGGSDSLTIKSGATFTMNGGDHFLGETKTINNYGTWNWTAGYFYLNILSTTSSPVVNNYGTFNINTDASVSNYSTSSTATFVNQPAGIINKTGSPSNYTSFSNFSSFTNQGTINVNSGRLRIYTNSTHSGTISVALGAAISFTGNTANFNTGTTLTGTGSIDLDGALININAPVSTSSCIINLAGSTLTGSSTLTMNSGSTFNWTGGVNGGSGILNINSGAIFTMNGGNNWLELADNKIINNYGTGSWTSSPFYYKSGSPAFNNYGTFNINTDNIVGPTGINTGTFTNKPGAVINKIGSPTNQTYVGNYGTDISGFDNQGTINVNSGNLRIGTNYTNSGAINVALGANIYFIDAIANFNAGSTFSGAGSTNFAGANIIVNSPITTATNIVNITASVITGELKITMGSGAVFNLSAGELNNSATITMNSGSIFNWTGGTIGGSDSIVIKPNAFFTINSINNPYPVLNDSKIINNHGLCTWISGYLDYKSGSPAFNNYGTFNINTDYDISYAGTNSGTFTNKSTGIINKTGSLPGETQISSFSTFTNEGTININSGNIGAYTNFTNIGTIYVALGSNMNFRDNTTKFNAGSLLTGSGSINFDGVDTVIINAPVVTSTNTINLSGGVFTGSSTLTMNTGSVFNWIAGINGGSGTLTINPGATLNMNGGGINWLQLADNKTINNSGICNWASGYLYYKSGSPTFNNYGTFNINTDYDVGQTGSNTGSFINQPGGVINKTGSASDETSFSSFNLFSNLGTINVITGNIRLNVSGVHSGIYNVSPGTELRGSIIMPFTGNSFTNSGNVTLSGLTFSGLSSQTLNGTGKINSITINNASGAALGGTQIINNTLTLTNGKFTLGNNNLMMGSAAISGGSSSSYIVVNGTGILSRVVSTSPVPFPVGHSNSYMPVIISLASGTDTFKVRALPNIYSSYDGSNNPIGSPITSSSVNGTWMISKATAGGSATVTLQWNGSDEAGGFNRANSRFGHFSAGTWSLDPILAASGSNPYSTTGSGITTFSPFGIINQFITCTNTYSPLCANQVVSVPYVAVGMNAGNKFTAQLSNASGSFSSPVNIGTKNSSASGTINSTIPIGTVAGSGYRIRVKSNNPAFTSTDNGSNISIGINKKYFQDSDGDTYGNQAVSQVNCSIPNGYVTDSIDCNDGNSAIHPGVIEICNGIDDNCNTQKDEGVSTTYYADADGDAFGNMNIDSVACSQPSNYVTNSTDCNDGNAAVHPTAPEICNGIDDNCIDGPDEAIAIYHYTDNTSGIPNSVSANATATSLLRVNGSGVPSFPCSNGGFSSKNFSTNSTFSTTLSAIEFTITPITGSQVQLTSFAADLRISSSGPDLVRYAYSTNGGLSWIDQGVDDSLEYTGCGIMTTYTWDFPDFSTDQPLKFRIYGFGASSLSGILQLMNVNLNGQVCSSLDADGDTYTIAEGDCNDNDDQINPGAPDICNGIDDNCNDVEDENEIIATIIPSGSVSICSGTSVLLTANSGTGNTYQWLRNSLPVSGATSSTYTVTAAGSYSVIESNDFSCSDTSNLTAVSLLSAPQATISTPGGTDLCATGSVLLQANSGLGITYQWKKGVNNTPIPGATNQTYSATTTGNYKVEVTKTSNGCKKTSQGVSVINSCKENIVENPKVADTFIIYPNPTDGAFVIELLMNEVVNDKATVDVISMLGQTVFYENIEIAGGIFRKEIQLSDNAADGMYLVRIIAGDILLTQMIQIDH